MEMIMDMGMIQKVDIDHEMQQSYLDYAMSVIVARALPDARDGLKPVQRRLLYAMYDMGLRPDSTTKKSARIVGEVLGKYHPHGDQAVYESLARMAQDFSLRYTMVNGQGNFGSIDGDPPAAMRYTEATITSFSQDLLAQIDRDTIDFTRNFDDSLNEPLVLPSAVPNLLINGASGIAVGMATSIPPHNLAEVIDASLFLLESWEKIDDVTIGQLMKYIKGPDFPTGGIIIQQFDQNELQPAYATGKGKITLRGRVSLEEMTHGKNRIIIHEIPYSTNKTLLIERIAELAREGNLDGVTDLRDESDRQGMRIVIELSKTADVDEILRRLYKRTPLEVTFSINLLALVNGEPHLLSLKQALKVYLEHRIEVVRRRSEFDLRKAQERIHILEGLRIAINNLDEVIKTIRASADSDQAKIKLMKKFKLSAIQATAILDMALKRLAALERKKIELEYKEVADLIKELQALLKSQKKIRQQVATELSLVREKYQDRRRTQIVSLKEGKEAHELLTVQDVTPVEVTWVGISQDNKLFRTHEDQAPKLSGREAPILAARMDSHQTLYIVSQMGKCAALAVHTIPVVESQTEGVDIHRLTTFAENEKPIQIFSLPQDRSKSNHKIVTISREGLIKKSDASELPGPSSQTFILVKVNENDELCQCRITTNESEYLVATRKGLAIRFSAEEVRSMGLVAAGVNAIKLAEGDQVVSFTALHGKQELEFLASDGTGWRIPEAEFPLQKRYGQGVIIGKLAPKTQLIGLIYGKKNQQFTVFLRKSVAKGMRIDAIPVGKRSSSSKKLFDLRPDDFAINVTHLAEFTEIGHDVPEKKTSKKKYKQEDLFK
jgi:DNA gyrase subunit A